MLVVAVSKSRPNAESGHVEPPDFMGRGVLPGFRLPQQPVRDFPDESQGPVFPLPAGRPGDGADQSGKIRLLGVFSKRLVNINQNLFQHVRVEYFPVGDTRFRTAHSAKLEAKLPPVPGGPGGAP